MPLFAFHCVDHPGSLELRIATRDAHLAYLAQFKDQVMLAGPLLDADQNPIGSMLFVELADRAAADAFAADDPYAKAGLFMAVEITGFRPSLGRLG